MGDALPASRRSTVRASGSSNAVLLAVVLCFSSVVALIWAIEWSDSHPGSDSLVPAIPSYSLSAACVVVSIRAIRSYRRADEKLTPMLFTTLALLISLGILVFWMLGTWVYFFWEPPPD